MERSLYGTVSGLVLIDTFGLGCEELVFQLENTNAFENKDSFKALNSRTTLLTSLKVRSFCRSKMHFRHTHTQIQSIPYYNNYLAAF